MRVGRELRIDLRTAGRLVAGAVVAALLTGCGMLGLREGGLVEVTPTTSAAPVAAADGSAGPVAVPTLQTGSAPASTPTPWQSLTTTAQPTTSSEPPITALSTTKTLTFSSQASVTVPTIVAPTAVRNPPPACYSSGACRVQASASIGGATVEVINEAVSPSTIVVLTGGGQEPTSLSVARLTSPSVDCTGQYCLVAGSRSGLYFGSLVLVKKGELLSVTGTASSMSPLRLLDGPNPVVSGTYRFDSYGVMLDDAPIAARTWAIVGGQFASTGCGQPYLYATPPAPSAPLSGACTGTPQIAGHGPASAHELTSLSGFVTPSGNIQCGLLPNDRLTCGAKQSSISVPACTDPSLKDTVGLTGLRVTVSAAGVVRKDNCIGYDLVGMSQTKIAYGRLAVARGFVCEVQEDGVTCTVPNGRGFSLNRSSLTTF